jgi:hypothetical protein
MAAQHGSDPAGKAGATTTVTGTESAGASSMITAGIADVRETGTDGTAKVVNMNETANTNIGKAI